LASSSHILSMIDGKPYRTLRPHLATYGLTNGDYRNAISSQLITDGGAGQYRVPPRGCSTDWSGKKASSQEPQGGEGAAVVAPSTMQRVTPVKLSSAEDGAPSSDKKAVGLTILKRGSGPNDGSSIATPASASAAQMAEGKSSGTMMPRRCEKLSLFATRTGENQHKSRRPYAVTSTADPRTSTEREGPSWSMATASGGQAHLAVADRATEPTQQDESVNGGTSTRLTLMDAIARKRAVRASYNSTVIKLAPQ
jgi:hypothetical protein